jgi:uncharacterized damage-inducible protein DinB
LNALDSLRRQLTWSDWANREALRSMREAGDAVPEARRLLSHVLGAERVWLARLHGEPSPLPVWPELTLDACEALLPELRRAWGKLLEADDATMLLRRVTYRNTKGEQYTSDVGDILTHVLMHGAYHRGQIAAAMRAAGCAPASTDFILAVRRGELDRT